MATSPRPDPSDPAAVASAGFSSARKGFDPDEVRTFLTAVGGELERLRTRLSRSESELAAARSAGGDLSQLDDETVARMLGDETASVLRAAREAATQIRARAEQVASELVDEATAEAARLREAAEEDASRRRSEAAAAASQEIETAKREGRELLDQARSHQEQLEAAIKRRKADARQWFREAEVEQRRLTEAIERARSTIDTVAATVRPTGFDVDLDAPEPEPVVSSGTGAIYDAAADDLDDGEVSIPPIVDATAVMEAVESEAQAVDTDSSGDDSSDDGGEGAKVVPLFAGGEPAAESSVDDIFARLREGAEADDGSTDEGDDAADDVNDESGDESDAEAAAFDELVAAASKKVKRVLADEQNAALETLRGKAKVNDLGDLVPTDVEHAASYTSTVTDEIDAAAVSGASTVGGSKPAARTLKRIRTEAIESISEGIVAVLRERLGAAVGAAAGDNDEISAKVRAVYRDVKTKVIDDRVGDALWQARSAAVVAAAPKGARLRWVVAPGAKACPDCEDNSLAAPVTAGEPFPTGHVNGPAHPGCRCRLVPDGR
ncbi:MAG: DivIVA domain-containing protein [Ilumatobacteraceae bacterium]